LRGLRDRWRNGGVMAQEVEQHVGAWIAHAEHANTWRLRTSIFRGGWFDPLNRALREPGRLPVASAFCAAGRGTTHRRTYAPPTATGTTPGTATTTTASGLPARPFAGTAATTVAAGEHSGVQSLP